MASIGGLVSCSRKSAHVSLSELVVSEELYNNTRWLILYAMYYNRAWKHMTGGPVVYSWGDSNKWGLTDTWCQCYTGLWDVNSMVIMEEAAWVYIHGHRRSTVHKKCMYGSNVGHIWRAMTELLAFSYTLYCKAECGILNFNPIVCTVHCVSF